MFPALPLMQKCENGSVARENIDLKYVAGSALLHFLALPFLLLWPIPSQNPALEEQRIAVQIVSLPVKTPEKKKPSIPPVAVPSAVKPVLEGEPELEGEKELQAPSPVHSQSADGTPPSVKPTHMLSEKVLADPHSSKARLTLSQLAPAEQVEQLCNLEAMAQIGAWNQKMQPDRVVAYAMVDTHLDGNSFTAKGAAVHSRDDWYRLQFKCDLMPDHKKVAAFEFILGDAIPKKDWTEHSLPDESVSLD